MKILAKREVRLRALPPLASVETDRHSGEGGRPKVSRCEGCGEQKRQVTHETIVEKNC